MNEWKKIFAVVIAVVLAFVTIVGAVEWFTVNQRDLDAWFMEHSEEVGHA